MSASVQCVRDQVVVPQGWGAPWRRGGTCSSGQKKCAAQAAGAPCRRLHGGRGSMLEWRSRNGVVRWRPMCAVSHDVPSTHTTCHQESPVATTRRQCSVVHFRATRAEYGAVSAPRSLVMDARQHTGAPGRVPVCGQDGASLSEYADLQRCGGRADLHGRDSRCSCATSSVYLILLWCRLLHIVYTYRHAHPHDSGQSQCSCQIRSRRRRAHASPDLCSLVSSRRTHRTSDLRSRSSRSPRDRRITSAARRSSGMAVLDPVYFPSEASLDVRHGRGAVPAAPRRDSTRASAAGSFCEYMAHECLKT